MSWRRGTGVAGQLAGDVDCAKAVADALLAVGGAGLEVPGGLAVVLDELGDEQAVCAAGQISAAARPPALPQPTARLAPLSPAA